MNAYLVTAVVAVGFALFSLGVFLGGFRLVERERIEHERKIRMLLSRTRRLLATRCEGDALGVRDVRAQDAGLDVARAAGETESLTEYDGWFI